MHTVNAQNGDDETKKNPGEFPEYRGREREKFVRKYFSILP